MTSISISISLGTGRRTARSAAGPSAFLAASAVLLGCGADGGDATTGKRLTLATRVTAEAEAVEPFTNSLGWTITLSKAHLSMGPLYYFDGAPFTAQRGGPSRTSPPLLERFARWVVPEAHAHPGHYQAGEARGQMLTPTSVDLLAGPTDLADADAVSGFYRSARVSFGSPPAGSFAAALEGHVAALEGRAEQDGSALDFLARVEVAEVLNADGDAAVEGCAFEEVDVQETGVVTLVVKPTVWLDQVDFAGIAGGEDGAPAPLPPDSAARRGFARGLKKGTAYALSFTAGAREKDL
jgi:hypothetical protein